MNTSLKEIGLENMLKTTRMKCNDLNLECVQFRKTYDFISSRNKLIIKVIITFVRYYSAIKES